MRVYVFLRVTFRTNPSVVADAIKRMAESQPQVVLDLIMDRIGLGNWDIFFSLEVPNLDKFKAFYEGMGDIRGVQDPISVFFQLPGDRWTRPKTQSE